MYRHTKNVERMLEAKRKNDGILGMQTDWQPVSSGAHLPRNNPLGIEPFANWNITIFNKYLVAIHFFPGPYFIANCEIT